MTYFRVLIASLVAHIVLLLIISKISPAFDRLKTKPSYVELMEKPTLAKRPHQAPHDEKEFVRNVQVPAAVQTNEKKKARFASEEERNVLEETRARVNDMTTNRSNASNALAKPQPPIEKLRIGKKGPKLAKALDLSPTTPLEAAKQRLMQGKAPIGQSDVRVGGMQKSATASGEDGENGRPMAPSFGGIEKGVSTLGETLPDDVKFGDFTALNTDRHLYYSFYARMEEKIRYRWITYARAALYNVSNSQLKSMGKENYTTQLEVILDPKGHFVRAILHEGSGLTTLDDAPVQAFRDAGLFPNPPPEMIKEDGVIHIYYAFNVNLAPGSLPERN